MKNLIKIIIASLLAISMLFCLFACDIENTDDDESIGEQGEATDGSDGSTSGDDATDDGNITDTTEHPAPTPEEMLDGAWEDAALAATAQEGVSAITTATTKTYQDGRCVFVSELSSSMVLSGDDMFNYTSQNLTYNFPEYGLERASMYQSITAIKQDDGYKVYILGIANGEKVCLLVNVTSDEANEAIEMLFGSQNEEDKNDNTMSILDFGNVSTSIKDDGSYEFTCTGIKEESVDTYTAIFAGNVNGNINADTLKYTIAVKDQRIMSMDIEVELESENAGGQTQYSTALISTVFDYSKAEITVPEAWDSENDIELSWTAYLESLG